jgi:hypothetical protein
LEEALASRAAESFGDVSNSVQGREPLEKKGRIFFRRLFGPPAEKTQS